MCVLAGVAERETKQSPKSVIRVESARPHVGELRLMRRHRGGGFRALNRHQRAIVQPFELGFAFQVGGDLGEVAVLAGGVDHDEQAVVVGLAGHQVVEHAAIGRQQQRIARARFQALVVAGDQFLEHPERISSRNWLAHVRHVEQPRVLARPAVLRQHAVVLHRHVVAGEPDHPKPSAQCA